MGRSHYGQRNFGVSVDDTRFEQFVKRMLDLGKLELRVGILRGTPKYPAGWVGTKSRQGDGLDRFASLQRGERARTQLAAYRSKKKKSPGYGRRARRKRVAVAKVAAVVGYEAGKRPKIPGLWFRTVDRMERLTYRQTQQAMELVLRGMSGRRAIEQIGTRLTTAFKADVLRTGHRDTGLLVNTVNWEVIDTEAQFAKRQLARARRIARRMLREGGRIRVRTPRRR